MTFIYGDWSTNQTFILDLVPPPPPLINTIPHLSTTSPIIVSGHGEPGSLLEIWLGNSESNLTASGITTTVAVNEEWTINTIPVSSEMLYISAKQTDIANNVSDFSNIEMTQIDLISPSCIIETLPEKIAYSSGDNITITLTASEKLQSTPILILTPNQQTPISITLNHVSGNIYEGSFTVTEAQQDGIALFTYTGIDLANNTGHVITSGSNLIFDSVSPNFTIVSGTSITNDISRTFHGEIFDITSGVANIKININGNTDLSCEIIGNSWNSPELMFISGNNIINAEAKDNAGNITALSVEIVKNILPEAPLFNGTNNILTTSNLQPTIIFVIPHDNDDLLDLTNQVHFKLQIASDPNFTTDIIEYESRLDQAGWVVDCDSDGNNGSSLTINGTNLYGHYGSYTFLQALSRQGNYYWRIAATDNVVG